MSGVYALYSSPSEAQRAVDALRESGIADRDITILSSEPLEEYEFGQRDRATWMPQVAVLGGAAGLGVAYLLISFTQQAWPLNTGGMPTVSLYANLIPLFELTMLGAVLATVAWLFVSAGLGRRRSELFDPEVSNGKILIGVVDCPSGAMADVERALTAGGSVALQKVGA